jgi:Fe-S oxidoreductase
MAVTAGEPDRAVFWYGCNMTRHGEILRATAQILQASGMDAAPAGGPSHCCGSPKDASARIVEGMASRTMQKFNASGRGQVVTWCPSCHMNMRDSMEALVPPAFATRHVSEVLWDRRERLRPLLVRRVEARVLLHAHLGFQPRVPVNELVPALLRLIPGVEVVEHPYRAPGHMCSSIAAVPGALADAQRATLAALAESGADTLCTIFHSCHREAVPLERHGGFAVRNWIHLLAGSMGIAAEDDYKRWRNAEDPRAAIGEAAIAASGETAFERLVEPELRKAPTV